MSFWILWVFLLVFFHIAQPYTGLRAVLSFIACKQAPMHSSRSGKLFTRLNSHCEGHREPHKGHCTEGQSTWTQRDACMRLRTQLHTHTPKLWNIVNAAIPLGKIWRKSMMMSSDVIGRGRKMLPLFTPSTWVYWLLPHYTVNLPKTGPPLLSFVWKQHSLKGGQSRRTSN